MNEVESRIAAQVLKGLEDVDLGTPDRVEGLFRSNRVWQAEVSERFDQQETNWYTHIKITITEKRNKRIAIVVADEYAEFGESQLVDAAITEFKG